MCRPDLGQFSAEQSHLTAENHQVAVLRVTLLTRPRPKSGLMCRRSAPHIRRGGATPRKPTCPRVYPAKALSLGGVLDWDKGKSSQEQDKADCEHAAAVALTYHGDENSEQERR